MRTLHRDLSYRTIVMAGIALLPAVAFAQEPLKLNVPYRCEDGVTRTVTSCVTNARGGEVCYWKEQQGGQTNERYNIRSQMDGWLKTCKAPDAAPAPAAQPAAATTASTRLSPTPNPPYLAGFPSVDKVKSDVRGANAVDTLARQVATLEQLAGFLRRMQMAPGRAYMQFTPDEQQLLAAYNGAASQMADGYTRTASAADAKTFQNLEGKYSLLDPTTVTSSLALLSPATRAQFDQINRAAGAEAQARADRINGTVNGQAPPPQPPQSSNASAPGRNDPGTLAARRCLELGGTELECAAKGLSIGFDDLTGIHLNALLAADTPRGIRIGGTFKTTSGEMLGFDEKVVNVASCGKLVPQSRAYSVTRRGDALQVEIGTAPKPLALTLGADGRFAGPPSFALEGEVIVGYQSVYVEQRRTSDNSVVVGSGHYEQRPIFEARTERCAFGSLGASAPTYAQSSVPALVGAIAQGQPDPASKRPETAQAPAGPRMSGTYAAAGGLRIEFQPTQAVLDCGDAHVVQPYATKNQADAFRVTIQNGNAAVALTLRPDGALSGSGSVDVTGRVVSGTDANGVTFAPRSARCNVGVLTPQQ